MNPDKEARDRCILAAVREYHKLHQNRYILRDLEKPYQRGWLRCYVLSPAAMNRPDRAILEAILKEVGSEVVHHSRKFEQRRGRSKARIEIAQPLRPIPVQEWQRRNLPDVWLRYLELQQLCDRPRHWQSCWVFIQPALYQLRIRRNWIHQVRAINPATERRLGELARWLEQHQAWPRYHRLKGHGNRNRCSRSHQRKRRALVQEQHREIRSALAWTSLPLANSSLLMSSVPYSSRIPYLLLN